MLLFVEFNCFFSSLQFNQVELFYLHVRFLLTPLVHILMMEMKGFTIFQMISKFVDR